MPSEQLIAKLSIKRWLKLHAKSLPGIILNCTNKQKLTGGIEQPYS